MESREIRRQLASLGEAILTEADEQYGGILDCLIEVYECCERQPPPWYTSLLGRRIEDALWEVNIDVPIIARLA